MRYVAFAESQLLAVYPTGGPVAGGTNLKLLGRGLLGGTAAALLVPARRCELCHEAARGGGDLTLTLTLALALALTLAPALALALTLAPTLTPTPTPTLTLTLTPTLTLSLTLTLTLTRREGVTTATLRRAAVAAAAPTGGVWTAAAATRWRRW